MVRLYLKMVKYILIFYEFFKFIFIISYFIVVSEGVRVLRPRIGIRFLG